MDEGSPPRIKAPFQRKLKRLQVRTPRDWHVEGVDLASNEEGDNGANQLNIKEAEQLPPLVVTPPLLQSSWVTFAPGTLQTLGGEGWKKDAHQAYLWHISFTIDVTAEEADALTTPVTRHMEQNRCRWHFCNGG